MLTPRGWERELCEIAAVQGAFCCQVLFSLQFLPLRSSRTDSIGIWKAFCFSTHELPGQAPSRSSILPFDVLPGHQPICHIPGATWLFREPGRHQGSATSTPANSKVANHHPPGRSRCDRRAQLLPWPPEAFVPVISCRRIGFSFSPRQEEPGSAGCGGRLLYRAGEKAHACAPAPTRGQKQILPRKGNTCHRDHRNAISRPAPQALGTLAQTWLSPARFPVAHTSCSGPRHQSRQGPLLSYGCTGPGGTFPRVTLCFSQGEARSLQQAL